MNPMDDNILEMEFTKPAHAGESRITHGSHRLRTKQPLRKSFDPPNPSIASTTPLGTTVATIVATWSDGQPFTGTLGFGPPNFDAGGAFTIIGNSLLINVSTKYRCHRLCHLQMSLGSGGGRARSPGVAQRPTGDRLTGV